MRELRQPDGSVIQCLVHDLKFASSILAPGCFLLRGVAFFLTNRTKWFLTPGHIFLELQLHSLRLSWAWHVDYLCTSCNKCLSSMRRIAGVCWGANCDILLQYYLSTIRPKPICSSSVYGSAARTILIKLDPLQNAALRISMGATKSSSVTSSYAESGPPHLLVHPQMGGFFASTTTTS